MTKTTQHSDTVRIHSAVQNPPPHQDRFLYHAFHTSYPCYVTSNIVLQGGQEIPFDRLNQQFKNAAINGVTTYHYKGPIKHGYHERPYKPSDPMDFEGGKDALNPAPPA